MIVKILKKSATFRAVRYNTGKVDKDRGELLLVRNFGALQGLENLRPQDYVNYLEAVSARSTRIKYPQFHVAISTKGRAHSKEDLSDIAQKWMEDMGYGNQPYLLIFHRDTANNHVHLVSTRVGRDGKKISDKYEKIRAYRVLNQIMGKDERQATSADLKKALDYSFSTRAQFMMILETRGYTLALKDGAYAISKYGKELASIDVAKVDERIAAREKDKGRVAQVRAIIERYRSKYDPTPYATDAGYSSTLFSFLYEKFGLQAVFHGKSGKPPYGYTLIDHAAKAVYKGGEVMPMGEFIAHRATTGGRQQPHSSQPEPHAWSQTKPTLDRPWETDSAIDTTDPDMALVALDISISDDIDDEATLGRNRRRKKKARTNTR
ncbi:relaxase/mobilization nuclease domain-containing protein [Parapedobacter soli]|uniref:relaxase/mobilization nuclease domain-containing protein n=1 Tax=Parapedobacter soli TaxID=416955 RepID=UPI0021C99389|nr:relaxase/mobilization nuclease domain-containing protein [Parapedobacter soli]